MPAGLAMTIGMTRLDLRTAPRLPVKPRAGQLIKIWTCSTVFDRAPSLAASPGQSCIRTAQSWCMLQVSLTHSTHSDVTAARAALHSDTPAQGWRRCHVGAALAQVSASVLSADEAHDPDVLSIIASSAALTCSDTAWTGPVGAVRIAVPSAGAAPVVNATREQAAAAVLSALIVGTEHGILSVEAEVMRETSALPAVPSAQHRESTVCVTSQKRKDPTQQGQRLQRMVVKETNLIVETLITSSATL